MDTGTHLVVGFGLAGLAYVDPVIASDATAATAVLVGTVIGSQAPDIDWLTKFRGNAAYIRNHRGMSHSLPALALWTGMIVALLGFMFGDLPLVHLIFWVGLAVALHVFSDLFNTYGTQAFWPLTGKWISWNIIHIFDPFIFVAHLIAIFLWAVNLFPPENIFPVLYGIIALYYIWRTVHHYVLERSLPLKDPEHAEGDEYYLIPTINLHVWNVVKRCADGCYSLGEWRGRALKWVDRVGCARHPAVEASKNHPDIASFLYFSSFSCAEMKEHGWGYEVRWMDVRYRHRKQYPFVAVLLLDRNLEPLDSYIGWVSEARLEKKLRVDAY